MVDDQETKLGEDRKVRSQQITGFEQGEYPYATRLTRRAYEAEKAALQVELLKVQHWIEQTDQKFVLLFEGRDAAGKGLSLIHI